MLICPEKKVAFVEIPRTGSTSLRKWLLAAKVGFQTNDEGPLVPPHPSWGVQFYRHCVRPPGEWREWRMFCVVRDPIERVLSLWEYGVGRLGLSLFGEDVVEFCLRDVRHFAEWLCKQQRLPYAIKPTSLWRAWHARWFGKQVDYLCGPWGEVSVIRMEDVNEVVPTMLRGILGRDVKAEFGEMPHENRTHRTPEERSAAAKDLDAFFHTPLGLLVWRAYCLEDDVLYHRIAEVPNRIFTVQNVAWDRVLDDLMNENRVGR